MKTIDGQIRKMVARFGSQVFYDFEFWAESDEDTYGLLCFVQLSNPTHLFLVEMNANEYAISDEVQALNVLKERVATETGITDLVFPKVIRFDKKKGDVKGGFHAFLSTYEKPIPVYESIYDSGEEAVQVKKLSVEQFRKIGGELTLIGDISMK